MRRGAKFMMMQTMRQNNGNRGSNEGARNEYGRNNVRNDYDEMRNNEMRYNRQDNVRNDGRWLPPYYEDMPRNNMDYGESRFRDRRGREHYDNGRFAPMRNELDDDDEMEDRIGRNVRNNYGRIVDINANYGRREIPARQIGFERMDNHYQGGSAKGGTQRMGGSQGHSEGLDMETAKEWTRGMKNEDGTTGPHWTMEQAKQLIEQRKLDVEPIEFYAILNAMYSDYCKVAKKHNINNMDFYVDLAMAWLDDEDAVPDKALMYYECIVK